ncbi:Glycosyl transferase 4-like domain-containing protein [Enhydrobacter aerosaccus]|uniref:Glycosyl transferase 4-like domain-containing protein n=1 Tax=Enhydrobacter aerosaccus TaxID=225324 RepID=A0A1T4TA89_9HYPH|nr:glycosyltransferase [Enhydrobacter aerosaccus]SKA37241.1 Glycosyl transferase 4-like domain-containing protein [Enhydrobacter aerosaccus]
MIDLLAQSPFDLSTERRLVIIADWLPPDFGAVGQYMLMRARSLAERGHEVTLLGLSSKEASRVQSHIGKGSLTEIRLAARPVPRGSLAGRLAWTIRTDLRLVFGAFDRLRQADGILFTGSPPFLIHFLVPLKPFWKGRLVYRITDFHPECLIAAQERPSLGLQALLALTNFWRRRVDAFEVLGEDQLRRLRATGVDAARIALVRDGSPVSFPPNCQGDPLPADLIGHCVLLYSGNYGIAHEVETVAEGYHRHHREGTGRVRLWLSASGAGTEELVRRFTQEKLPFHRSAPVPLERLPGLLRAPHAHLVTLKDRFVGYVMPSKIYACLESGRPLIFVGSAESDVDLLARTSGVRYWRTSCGDPAMFASALEELADSVCRAGTAAG